MLIIGPAEHLHNLISLSFTVKYICCVCVKLPSSLNSEQWHFLAECAIAFHKMCFKASCHTAPNCTLEHYKSFHFHFFAFHSLHLILEVLKQSAFWLSCLPEGVSTTMLVPKWLKNQNEKLPEWKKGGRETGKWAKKKMKKKHWGEKQFFNCTTNFIMQVLDLTLIKVIGM